MKREKGNGEVLAKGLAKGGLGGNTNTGLKKIRREKCKLGRSKEGRRTNQNTTEKCDNEKGGR